MESVKKASMFLKQLARFEKLSDGAKVTLLEFVQRFWARDDEMPSYAELCEYRQVVKSTIQSHIEELEECGVLVSVRLPNNHKQYRLVAEVITDKVVKKKGKRKIVLKKPKAKYTTYELCGYFYFKLNALTGRSDRYTRPEINRMKVVHRRRGATEVIGAVDKYHRTYKRKGIPFTLDYFLENTDEFFKS
jgi:DNA-binding transcriptional ArsR family regulator